MAFKYKKILFTFIFFSLNSGCGFQAPMTPTVLNIETRVSGHPIDMDMMDIERVKNQFSITGTMRSVSRDLGGLTPSVPISEFESDECEAQDAIITRSEFPFGKKLCKIYVVKNNDSFKLLKNQQDFSEFFSPVSTHEEALSFAVAVNPSVAAQYDFTLPSSYTYALRQINKTNVENKDENYRVNLFSNKCNNTVLNEHIFLVSKSGTVTPLETQNIFSESAKQNLYCE